MTAVELEPLLEGIVGVLVDSSSPGSGGNPKVGGLAILDPDDEFGDHHNELVLVIGVRGHEALPYLRAAARSGAVAVAVKTGPRGAVAELAAAATEAGVVLVAVRPQVRWDQLGALLRERLEAAELTIGLGHDRGHDAAGEDLFALAEATALVTGGIVSIEDAANRVLAYSRSDDAVDELRRLSILGWQGPDSYMRMLREWGVLDRLRSAEQVVTVDAHPELGILARLAVGVRAGSRYLGTIWVQQRSIQQQGSAAVGASGAPFAEHAEDALIGAARLVAAEIVRRRTGAAPTSKGAQLVELLTGRANTDLVAGRLGLDPTAPSMVVGFGGPVESDVPVRDLHHDQLRSVVSMYATAYRRSALVSLDGQRVYAVLSGPGLGPTDPGLRSWVRDAVLVARDRSGVGWFAGIGTPTTSLAGLADARTEVDRVLDALAMVEEPAPVAGIAELRTELLLGELFDLLEARPELRSPAIDRLCEHDAARGGELVISVLAYLDALGDVRSAAASLHVHPNTLRHRLNRARALSGIDLAKPDELVSFHLQLSLAARRPRQSAPR